MTEIVRWKDEVYDAQLGTANPWRSRIQNRIHSVLHAHQSYRSNVGICASKMN